MDIQEAWIKLTHIVANRIKEISSVQRNENPIAEGGRDAYKEVIKAMDEANGIREFIGKIETKLELEDKYKESERMAYVECLEILQEADEIEQYGLNYDIEKKYPVGDKKNEINSFVGKDDNEKRKNDDEYLVDALCALLRLAHRI